MYYVQLSMYDIFTCTLMYTLHVCVFNNYFLIFRMSENLFSSLLSAGVSRVRKRGREGEPLH